MSCVRARGARPPLLLHTLAGDGGNDGDGGSDGDGGGGSDGDGGDAVLGLLRSIGLESFAPQVRELGGATLPEAALVLDDGKLEGAGLKLLQRRKLLRELAQFKLEVREQRKRKRSEGDGDGVVDVT